MALLTKEAKYVQAIGLAVFNMGLHGGLATVDGGLALLPGYLKGHVRVSQGWEALEQVEVGESQVPNAARTILRDLHGLCAEALVRFDRNLPT